MRAASPAPCGCGASSSPLSCGAVWGGAPRKNVANTASNTGMSSKRETSVTRASQ